MTGNMPRSPGEVGVKSSASGVPAACRPSAHGGRLYRSRWGGVLLALTLSVDG